MAMITLFRVRKVRVDHVFWSHDAIKIEITGSTRLGDEADEVTLDLHSMLNRDEMDRLIAALADEHTHYSGSREDADAA